MYAHHTQSHVFVSPSFRFMALIVSLLFILSSLSLSFPGTYHNTRSVPPLLNHNIPAQPVSGTESAGVLPDLDSLPLSFIPNAGQTDSQVQFQSLVMGGQAYFLTDNVVLALPTRTPIMATAAATADQTPATTIVGLQFVGSNPAATVQGSQQQAGITNYIYGSDPAQWVTHVPNYGGITYQQIYPGIDLHYDGSGGVLKGTYVVAAGANPNLIRWMYTGATSVELNGTTGALHIGLAGTSAPLIEKAPVAWQVINGTYVPVMARYTLTEQGRVGFALGAYNPSYALTIDPAFTYAAYVGASQADSVNGLAVDNKEGFVYVTGRTTSPDFEIINPLPYNFGTRKSSDDIFVRKINAKTNETVYSTFMGGQNYDEAHAIALGSQGHAYITGFTKTGLVYSELTSDKATNPPADDYYKTSFPISPTMVIDPSQAEETWPAAYRDNTTLREKYKDETAPFVVSEYSAYRYLLDNQTGIDGGGKGDAFVAKLSPDGSELIYCTYIGGTGEDIAYDIDVHTFQDKVYGPDTEYAYITGKTDSDNLEVRYPLPGRSKISGANDAFVTVIGAEGKNIELSSYLGGTRNDTGYGIQVLASTAGTTGTSGLTSNPYIYIAGETESPDMFSSTSSYTTNVVLKEINDGTESGKFDAFVTRIFSHSGALSYTLSTYMGGSGDDKGRGIAIDTDGDMYIAGVTNSTGFFGNGDSYQQNLGGGNDAFMTKISGSNGTVAATTYIGGNADDEATSIDVDSEKNVYVAGSTRGSFPIWRPVPKQETYGGGDSDAFVTKFFSTTKTIDYSTYVGGNGADIANDIVVQGAGTSSFAFIAGTTKSGDFPITSGSSRSGDNSFIAKIGPPRLLYTNYDTDTANPTLSTRKPKPVSEGSGTVLIETNLTDQSSTPYQITFSTRECGEADTKATIGDDFESFTRSHDVLTGTTLVTDTVGIVDDSVDELNEIFCVDASSGFGETQTLTVTIGDNDGPNISFASPTATGNEAAAIVSANATLQVQLDQASPQEVKVPVTSAPVSASASDYELTTQDVTFAPGETTKEVTVDVKEDTIKERDENVQVVLGTPALDDTPLFNPDTNSDPDDDSYEVTFNSAANPQLNLRRAYTDQATTTMTIKDNPATAMPVVGFASPPDVTASSIVTYTVSPASLVTFPMTGAQQVRAESVFYFKLEGDTTFGENVKVKVVPQGTTGAGMYTLPDSYELTAEQTSFPVGGQTYGITLTVEPDMLTQVIPIDLAVVDTDQDLAEVSTGTTKSATLIIQAIPRLIYLPMIYR